MSREIEKAINHLESMLAVDKIAISKREYTAGKIGRFSYDEVESLQQVIKVVKLLGVLLDFMGRPIISDEDD